MSRLMTRAPTRAVAIGNIMMKYVKGNPGIGLHYCTLQWCLMIGELMVN